MDSKIKFKKLHLDAWLPEATHKDKGTGDTGYDLCSVEDSIIPARGSSVVDVGLQVAHIPPGFWFQIQPRSGLGFKSNIQPHLGVIDNQYRGSLAVKLYNFGDEDVKLPKGKAIAQIVIHQLNQMEFDFAEEVTETTRGEKGFGSSG